MKKLNRYVDMLVKALCFKRRYVKAQNTMVNKAALMCGVLLVLLILICYLFTSVDLGKLQKNIQDWTKSKISQFHGDAEEINEEVLIKPLPPIPPLRNNSIVLVPSKKKVSIAKDKPPTFFNDTLERFDGIRVYDWNIKVKSNASCVPLKNLHQTTYICLFEPRDDFKFSHALLTSGQWDRNLLREFRLLLARKQDLNLLDIGSNLGIYTLTAAMLGHKTVCVEPFGPVIPPFHKAVVLNKFQDKIILLPNAISKDHEFVKLSHIAKDMTSAVVSPAHEEDLTLENIATQKIVSAITWKELANFLPFKKIVLKYDISLRNHNNNLITEAKDLFSTLDVQYVFMHWSNFLLDAASIVSFFTTRSYIPRKEVFGTKLSLLDFPKWRGGVIWEKQLSGRNHEF